MPEVPELRHSRDVLRNIIVGKSIARFLTTSTGRYSAKQPEGMSNIINDLPLRVETVDTKGKFMWWTLKGQDKTWYMWCTYGMSGQWSRTAGKHAAFIVEYNGSGSLVTRDQQKLFFNDTRRFGTIKFVCDQLQHDKKLNSLGPDVLEDHLLDPELFAERILHYPSKTIAEVLMNQTAVSGIGNYLKSEILYRSSISPHRLISSLSNDDILRIWSESLIVPRESYADHGASIRTYRTVEGDKGDSQFQFRIYNKKFCPCGHDVCREETLDKRTSWWCKICQI